MLEGSGFDYAALIDSGALEGGNKASSHAGAGAAAVGGELSIGVGLDQEGIFKGAEMPGFTSEGVGGGLQERLKDAAFLEGSALDKIVHVAGTWVGNDNPTGALPNAVGGNEELTKVGSFEGVAKATNLNAPTTPVSKVLDPIDPRSMS